MQLRTCHQMNRYIDQPCWPPLVRVQLDADGPAIWCKLEFLNPSGSTSIAMALTCAQLGLAFVAVMPEGVSKERVLIIREYGGDCVFTPSADGIAGALRKAEALAEKRDADLEELVELQIEDDDALAAVRQLIRLGFPVGASSGLNYCAAIEAAIHLPDDATIVTVFPDRMERYFSTELFD